MYGWLELMVHHTPSKARARSAPVFIHPPMVYPFGVVWPVWMWSPCLVAYTMVYQHHPCTFWWIESGAKICIDSWSSWYTTHHTRQRMKVPQFSSIYPWNILRDVWSVWMWPPCLFTCAMVYQPHPCIHWWIDRGLNIYIDGWSSWYITHHPRQRTKVPQFLSDHLPMVYPLDIVWPVWMWSPCLVACTMVDQPYISTCWWIESGVNTCMVGWSSWYITYHPM